MPRPLREAWRPLVESFITSRAVLRLVIVIVDARRGPEQEEVDLLEWLDSIDRDALVVLTKSDKLPKSKRHPAAAAAKQALGLRREPLLFSAETGEGIVELWRAIVASASGEARG